MRMAISNVDGHGAQSPADRRTALVEWARHWSSEGVELLQLREKQLDAGEVFDLARAMLAALPADSAARLLINGRADLAAAAGAHGVHLTGHPGELTPAEVRRVFGGRPAFVSASCHTVAEVQRAREGGADAIVFGPVFEKRVAGRVVVPGIGLEVLANACRAAACLPVLALGGVDEANVADCVSAGAAGFASIRAFAKR